jgi:hypothetical protein
VIIDAETSFGSGVYRGPGFALPILLGELEQSTSIRS